MSLWSTTSLSMNSSSSFLTLSESFAVLSLQSNNWRSRLFRAFLVASFEYEAITLGSKILQYWTTTYFKWLLLNNFFIICVKKVLKSNRNCLELESSIVSTFFKSLSVFSEAKPSVMLLGSWKLFFLSMSIFAKSNDVLQLSITSAFTKSFSKYVTSFFKSK